MSMYVRIRVQYICTAISVEATDGVQGHHTRFVRSTPHIIHIVKAMVGVDRLTLPRDLPTICFILSFYALSSISVFYRLCTVYYTVYQKREESCPV